MSIYLSVRLSVYPYICLLVCLSVYLSLGLSVFLSIYLSICLSICLFVCLSAFLFICQFIYVSVYIICMCKAYVCHKCVLYQPVERPMRPLISINIADLQPYPLVSPNDPGSSPEPYDVKTPAMLRLVQRELSENPQGNRYRYNSHAHVCTHVCTHTCLDTLCL